MSHSLIKRATETPERQRLYLQERSILEVTETICRLMVEKNVKRSELAKRLGKTKGFVTQLLSGKRNMTVRTVSDVLWALDSCWSIRAQDLSKYNLQPCIHEPFEMSAEHSDLKYIFVATEGLLDSDLDIPFRSLPVGDFSQTEVEADQTSSSRYELNDSMIELAS